MTTEEKKPNNNNNNKWSKINCVASRYYSSVPCDRPTRLHIAFGSKAVNKTCQLNRTLKKHTNKHRNHLKNEIIDKPTLIYISLVRFSIYFEMCRHYCFCFCFYSHPLLPARSSVSLVSRVWWWWLLKVPLTWFFSENLLPKKGVIGVSTVWIVAART